MTISRFWNSLSWVVVATALLAPVTGIAWYTVAGWLRTGRLEDWDLYGSPTALATLGVLAVLGSLCVLASLDQARRYLDERALAMAQSDFVSAVSHELRTPLTTIRLYAEMLRSGAVPEERREEFWDGLAHENDRLERLVEDVLAYRRLADSGARLALAEHRASDLAAEAIAATRPLLFAAGMTLETDLPEGLAVKVDRSLVVGALVNLLTNAAKYAAAGEVVRLEARADGRHVTFVVADRGPGIPAAERKRVFKPFYRIGSALTRERDGMGLGLTLAAAAAKRHRGRLVLADAPGAGAAFHLSVPAAKGRPA